MRSQVHCHLMKTQCSNKTHVLSHSEVSFIKNEETSVSAFPRRTQERNISGRAIVSWSEKYFFFFSVDAEVNCGVWSLWNTLHSWKSTISWAITQPTKLNIPNALSRRQLKSLIWKRKKKYFLLWITWIKNREMQRGIADFSAQPISQT